MAMTINWTEVQAPPAQNAVDLTITQTGMTITVEAGSFTIASVGYTLATDQNFIATADPTNDTVACGYLVKEISTGDIELMVDEVVMDGVDTPFDLDDGTYQLLHNLFAIKVPTGVANLDTETMEATKIVPLVE